MTAVDDKKIMIPYSMLIPFVDDTISLQNSIDDVFLDLNSFKTDSLQMLNSAMLTTKIDFGDEINDLLL